MAENIYIPQGAERAEIYDAIIPQIRNLVDGESDLVANLANVSSVLKEAFGFFWVGFYVVKGDELVLGPFQGTLACTRIRKGKGVCGTAWQTATTQLVADVDKFPGHIACSSASRSEVVVPIVKNGAVVAVLDVDSDSLDDFSEVDTKQLEQIAHIIGGIWS